MAGWDWMGRERNGLDWQDWLGAVWRDAERIGEERFGMAGMERVGLERSGTERRGEDWSGRKGEERTGKDWRGLERRGLAGMERILQISKDEGLSHIGSSLGVYQTLVEVKKEIQPKDILVLDAAHGALGYYVYLEELGIADAEQLFEKHGVHQSKDLDNEIYVSGGSLGLAGSIALGMALANKKRNIFVITSDGALAEGIWAETLRVKADMGVDNLRVFVNANGWSAYDAVDVDKLEQRIHATAPDVVFVRNNTDTGELRGLNAHYGKIK